MKCHSAVILSILENCNFRPNKAKNKIKIPGCSNLSRNIKVITIKHASVLASIKPKKNTGCCNFVVQESQNLL